MIAGYKGKITAIIAPGVLAGCRTAFSDIIVMVCAFAATLNSIVIGNNDTFQSLWLKLVVDKAA